MTERDGQVDPQPRAQPIREYLQPLAGAKITDFKSPATNRYELTYEINGKPGYVRYVLSESGKVDFTFVDPSGKSTSEAYSPRGQRPPGKNKEDRGPRRRENDRPPPPRGGTDRPPSPADSQGKSHGPAPDGIRKPWIAEHFPELDVNSDQVLTRDEMLAEVDARCDEVITKPELLDFATQLFDKSDRDQDGKTTPAEAAVMGPGKRTPRTEQPR